MTSMDTKNFDKLTTELKGLCDKQGVKPIDFLPILEALQSCQSESASTFHNPAAFVEYPPSASHMLWGLYYDYFWHIGENAGPADWPDFIRCAELIPDDGIVHEMLAVEIDSIIKSRSSEFEQHFASSLPSFLTDGKWNGNKTLLYVIRLLVETAGVQYDNATDYLKAIINSRSEIEKPTVILAIVSQIVFALHGDLSNGDNTKEQNALRLKNKESLVSFYQSIVPEIEIAVKDINFELISAFYGLDLQQDAEAIKDSLETGLIPHGKSLYAQALIVSRLIDVELPDEQWSILLQRSVFFEDCALSWSAGAYKTLGIYAGAVITQSSNPAKVWAEAIKAWNCLIYRAINGEDQSQYESRLDCYLGTTACATDALLLGGKAAIKDKEAKELAFRIWERAWNDCVTALHSCFFPVAAFHMSIVLFVYAVLNFLDRKDHNELLNQLPWVQLRNRGSTDSREMCLVNLAKNGQSSALKPSLDEILGKYPNLRTAMNIALQRFDIEEQQRKRNAELDDYLATRSHYRRIR